MILQALASYHDRLAKEASADVPPEGFEKKEIPCVIVVDLQGAFKGLQDTRTGEGKKKRGRVYIVPKAVKRSSGIAANLLWDNPTYVLGCPKTHKKKDETKSSERAKDQHAAFLSRIREAFPSPVKDEGVDAVVRFLERGDFAAVFTNARWPEIEESGANVSFQLEGDLGLICQRREVVDALTQDSHTTGENRQMCLVTGEIGEPVRLHSAIKGVWGAQPSGANIVAINTLENPAFGSYGKAQGYNAPVGKKAEFAYTTALNTLLAKGSRQRIQVGDASTVFWAAQPNRMEDWFADFFGEPAKEESAQDTEAIKALYAAPVTGAPPLDEDMTPFYVLGLAPNASRIAIRFWHAGTVGQTAKHVRQHFDDVMIDHGPAQPEHLSLFRLLVSTAVQGKSDNIQPNLAGEVMLSILTGTPYPQTLLASAIRRVRAEHEITDPRAAVIKAVLVRSARYYQTGEREVQMSLDTSNANAGYRLGRLFAVLERSQEQASPGINATIRDRFYGAASSTPVAAFPHLLKLKNHHIAKLESRGLAVNLEKTIGEIMEGLDDFPAHLNLADQGRFAIGYYHQRQAFFTKGGAQADPK